MKFYLHYFKIIKISKIYLTEFEDNATPQNGLFPKLPTENFKMQSTYSHTDKVITYNGEYRSRERQCDVGKVEPN